MYTSSNGTKLLSPVRIGIIIAAMILAGFFVWYSQRHVSLNEAKDVLTDKLFSSIEEGIVGVGLGECKVDSATTISCIKVFLASDSPALREKVPSEFKGFRVETEITGPICMQDAKLCPDGSTVGRAGSNCEFAACP